MYIWLLNVYMVIECICFLEFFIITIKTEYEKQNMKTKIYKN